MGFTFLTISDSDTAADLHYEVMRAGTVEEAILAPCIQQILLIIDGQMEMDPILKRKLEIANVRIYEGFDEGSSEDPIIDIFDARWGTCCTGDSREVLPLS